MFTVIRQLLILVATVIFLLGVVMIFSTTSAEILELSLGRNPHIALYKQLMYAAAGLVLAWGVYAMGYKNLLAYSQPLLILFTILLLLTLIPGIGREVNGSRRWIHLAGLSFQPSEFVKYLVPAFFIHKILGYPDGELPLRDFFKLVGCVSVPMVLILVEPNNGTTAVVALTLLMVFFVTRIPFRYWAWPLIAFTCVVGTFASQLPYVAARIRVYMHPELDLKGKGHQPYQAKIAAGSGKFLGVGPGNSLQKLSYLPEAQNDYIAAIYAEEFGFLGIVVLISLYLTLASCGFTIAHRACDQGGFYLAVTATFLLSFQAFLNMGVVIGLLPSTGLNLPLFSQGGSSLMANMVGLAILLNVSQESQKSGIRGSHA